MNKNLTATLKYALLSHKKMALIAKLVVKKNVEDALHILEHLPKKGAKILHKVIKSAINNARQSGENGMLYVKEIKVGAGPKLKRIRFVSRSRISHYQKFRSFVQVILGVKQAMNVKSKVNKVKENEKKEVEVKTENQKKKSVRKNVKKTKKD